MKSTILSIIAYFTIISVLPAQSNHIDFGVPDFATDGFVDLSGNPEFNLGANGAPFTMEVWILRRGPQHPAVGLTHIFNNYSVDSITNNLAETEGISLDIPNNRRIRFRRLNADGTFQELESNNQITDNIWHHVAITYEGNIARLYINGVLNGQAIFDDYQYDGDNHVFFGIGGGAYTQPFPGSSGAFRHNGAIDEARIWDIALTEQQIREMMNQKIVKNGSLVAGAITSMNIDSGSLAWSNLIGYYQMDDVDGDLLAFDSSLNGRDGTAIMEHEFVAETSPLPYTTTQDGDWNDPNTWEQGAIWNLPNGNALDGTTPIDWNIVETSHHVTSPDSDLTLLGLVVASNTLAITDPTDTAPLPEENTGHSLNITHYLKIDGTLDLVGESQLLQNTGSIVDPMSIGNLEIDQQGVKDLYTYNIWSSPVIPTNVTVTDGDYTVETVLKDGSDSNDLLDITFVTSGYDGSPGDSATDTAISIADYWIWKFTNLPGEYANWIHVRKNGALNIGEGYTMKGVDVSPPDASGVFDTQNYAFVGLPNNGEHNLTVNLGNDYLVGNPYPSAIDVEEFILDNIKDSGGRNSANVINGAVYFWEHIGGGSHILASYVGGYATRNLTGYVQASSIDPNINNNGEPGTKIPGEYIPVGQGFFVSAAEYDGPGDPSGGTYVDPDGGTLVFKNSQRSFARESDGNAVFYKPLGMNKPNTRSITEDREQIKLGFHSDAYSHRQILIGTDENATNNYDIGYDALQVFDDSMDDMYWELENVPLTIQGVNNFDINQRFPIGIKVVNSGGIRIAIDELTNIPPSKNIYLLDKSEGVFHDLRISDYEIDLDAGEYSNRFELVFEVYGVYISPNVYLQGASINPNVGEELLMRDNLRIANIIPTTSPYSDALTCNASIFTTAGNDAIVDWVWVELRDASDPTLIIDATSAFLQRDGDVVAKDGTSALNFYVNDNSYYVVINHRNHLGIMSNNTVALNGTTYSLDLSVNSSDVQGGDHAVTLLGNGFYGMYALDTDGNGQADIVNKKNFFLKIGLGGYLNEDLDLNGQVQNTDIQFLLYQNYLRGEQFSTVRGESPIKAPNIFYEVINEDMTKGKGVIYYEADIQISSSEALKLGDGVLYFNYNTDAFGENIVANDKIELTFPTASYVLGQEYEIIPGLSFPYYQTPSKALDNATGSFAFSWEQKIPESYFENNVTTNSSLLVHLKIEFLNDNEQPELRFETDNTIINGLEGYTLRACGGTTLGAPDNCINQLYSVYLNSGKNKNLLSDNQFEIETVDEISLYPNPTNGWVNLQGDISKITHIEVFNTLGHKTKSFHADFEKLDVSNLDSGIYFIQIYQSNNDRVYSKTIIKTSN